MKYHKLVRDKIPEIIKKHGGDPVTRIADDREYGRKLKEKLREEVKEFMRKESVEELADILEVIYALGAFKKVGRGKLEQLRIKKARGRGRFGKRIILEEVL